MQWKCFFGVRSGYLLSVQLDAVIADALFTGVRA